MFYLLHFFYVCYILLQINCNALNNKISTSYKANIDKITLLHFFTPILSLVLKIQLIISYLQSNF